eukprot:TRINITY_DN1726_c0_g1_i1.p1 TRINITY_DN1726_c0_g1~~TRINITY_DN1726_c0_g1_i1.p1  ORF type:complete len:264 (+),score=48.40 TRINITY_DN1726_c0_g1_i1:55-846(+)
MYLRTTLAACMIIAVSGQCNSSAEVTCLSPYVTPANDNVCETLTWGEDLAQCMCTMHYITCCTAENCPNVVADTCTCETLSIDYDKTFNVEYGVGDVQLANPAAFKTFLNNNLGPWMTPSMTVVTMVGTKATVAFNVPRLTLIPTSLNAMFLAQLSRLTRVPELSVHNLTVATPPTVTNGLPPSSSDDFPIGGILGIALGSLAVAIVLAVVFFFVRKFLAARKEEKQRQEQEDLRAKKSFRKEMKKASTRKLSKTDENAPNIV